MWLATCAGSFFLHSSPSLQEDVRSLLMPLLEPAFNPWASRSFELSLLSLLLFSSPLSKPSANMRTPAKGPLEWRPCAPRIRGKYYIHTYFTYFFFDEQKLDLWGDNNYPFTSGTHLYFTNVCFGNQSMQIQNVVFTFISTLSPNSKTKTADAFSTLSHRICMLADIA